MKYISLFSGIEAASVAWGPLGWKPIAFCEIDEFPSAVLAHHYPSVPNLGDITKVNWKDVIAKHGRPDVVVGGSPCQSFSIAGGRESLGGESRLMFEYIRACDEIHSSWIVWENVPGVFSVKDGAFQQLLESLQDIGYVSIAWRVLDAQFFGVAQRRRRVFLVGCARGGAGAAASVLFESESVSGNTTSSKQKREALAADARRCAQGAGGGCLTPWNIQSKRVFTPNSCGLTLNRGAGMTTTQSVLTQDGDDVSRTLTARMDGSPCIDRGPTIVAYCDCLTSNGEDMVGTLCARDYKGVGSQYVSEGKVIACRKDR